MTFDEEWLALGRRLKEASPERFDELVAKLRELAEVREEAARLVATGRPAARAILAPPRSRESH